MITREQAAAWTDRWDAQQTRYIADREERFAVIGDVVEVVGGQAPTVLDVGCGPGSLAARLAQRLPRATVIGVDVDPLLLGLAAAVHGDRVRFVDADVTTPGWSAALAPVESVDAAVSTTALHWIEPDRLARLYADLARLLRPGGVLVNGDHLPPADPTIADLARTVEHARADRAGVTSNEEWAAWWAATADDPTLAALRARRAERELRHGYGNKLSVDTHIAMLRAAGFTTAGHVWQSGTDHVLVAVR